MGLVLNGPDTAMRPLFVRRRRWHRLPTRLFGMVVGAAALGSLMVLWLRAH